MKINFDWQKEIAKTEQSKKMQNKETDFVSMQNKMGLSFLSSEKTFLNLSGENMADFGYLEQESFSKKVLEASNATENLALQRDFMTVMSNTMSTEDFQAMEEDGFSIKSMEPEMAVTILDKIKTVLAQSGTTVAGYNDDLSVDKLQEITGNSGYANQIADRLKAADVPVTEENVKQVAKVLEQALSLEKPTEEKTAYMVAKKMETTLSNFYFAKHSSGLLPKAGKMTGYASGGYDRQGSNLSQAKKTKVSADDYRQMEEQIKNRLQADGLEGTGEQIENGKWLLEKGLPVTGENSKLLENIQSVSFPLEPLSIIENAANAIGEGTSPFDIPLNQPKENIYKKAVSLLEKFSAREEIRLQMTVEANLKLLQSGYSIDTAPIEDLIDHLKDAKRQWEESLFGKTDSTGKGEIYTQTLQQVQELPFYPIDVVGKIPSMENPTLEQVAKEGLHLQQSYEKVSKQYEPLMTAPRGDLGDRIQKAFRNVDDILEDMGLEISQANQRAIRIMGYNQISISEENLEKIKQADVRIQSVISKMNPGVTLEMIREGKNPLSMSLEELETYLNEKQQEFPQTSEKYSSFLYKLEKNQEITQAERKAYIGVYRLLRQIEKSDGAVLGSLMKQGAEVNFKNLLSSLRSRKVKAVDVTVDDSMTTLKSVNKKGESISDQIEEGILKVQEQLEKEMPLQPKNMEEILREVNKIETDSQLQRQYSKAQMQEIRQIVKESSGEEEYLKQYEQPVTIDALQSVAALRKRRGEAARQIVDLEEVLRKTEPQKTIEEGTGILEESEEFVHKLDTQERDVLFENLTNHAKQVLEETLEMESTDNGYLDVKRIQMLYKQVSMVSNLAKEENYEIPMQIGQETTSINLTILHNRDKKGEVCITMDTGQLGKVEARFTMQDNVLEGSVLTDYMDGKERMEQNRAFLEEALKQALEETKIELKQMFFGIHKDLDLNALHADYSNEKTQDTGVLYKVAKEFIRYIKTCA